MFASKASGSKSASSRLIQVLIRLRRRMIEDYLALTGHRRDVDEGALFRPVKNNRTGRLDP
jgi:hypothetical protein